MAEVMKSRRLINPGKKRLTWKQKLHFGTKRQRAAAQARMHNPRVGKGPNEIYRRIAPGAKGRRFKKALRSGHKAKQKYYASEHYGRRARRFVKARSGAYEHRQSSSSRLPNVGEIITIRPLVNNGTSKSKRKGRKRNPTMAKSRKRRLAGLKAARTRKRRMSTRRASNPASRRRHRRRSTIVYRARTRRRSNLGITHRRRHHRRYRRNPSLGASTGSFSKAVEVIAGAIVTGFAMGFVNSFSPTLNTGVPGYIATAVVAVLQGKAIGKLLKNPSLGNNMTTGGFVYLALRIAKDFSVNLPIGLQGLGLVGPSSFWTPQVNVNGSMGNFIQPAMLSGAIRMAAPAPAAGGMHGVRRVGRMR